MSVNNISLRLITYGCGDAFDRARFVPVQNRQHVKPFGGLWASPVDCAYGWREWCTAEDYGNLESSFQTLYKGHTLIIDSLADLTDMIWQRTYYCGWPDYEAMLHEGIAGIYLTERGQIETRFSIPGLYGYDCECVLVLNPDCVVAS